MKVNESTTYICDMVVPELDKQPFCADPRCLTRALVAGYAVRTCNC